MNIVFQYWQLGILHVFPTGLDHMLFITALFFLSSKFKTALIQCSVFTLAHSITLFLAVLGYLRFNSKWIEIIIALSIFIVAVENLILQQINWHRLLLIFLFGLIHGLGFATALSQQPIVQSILLKALFGFNLGVETAQAGIIVFCYFLFARGFSHKVWYQKKLVQPISLTIACIALFWTVERFLA